jgi:hypothetical protein
MEQFRESDSSNSYSDFLLPGQAKLGQVKVSDYWATTVDPDVAELFNLPRAEIRRMNSKLSNLIENKEARKRIGEKINKRVEKLVEEAKSEATIKADLIVGTMFTQPPSPAFEPSQPADAVA